MAWHSDISNVDLMKLKFHDPEYKFAIHENLLAGFNERYKTSPNASYPLPSTQRLDLWPESRIAYQSKRDALFAVIANHAVNGGNFDGLESIPVWTKADIFTALGESEIPAAISTDLPAWYNQQYRIINLLRRPVWTGVYLTSSMRQGDGADNDFDTAFDEAFTAYDSAGYSGSVIQQNGTYAGARVHPTYGYYDARCVNLRGNASKTVNSAVFDFNFDLEYYSKTQKYTFWGGNSEYYSVDGLLEGRFYSVGSPYASPPPGPGILYSGSISHWGKTTEKPNVPVDSSWEIKGAAMGNLTTNNKWILNYQVTGGYEFKDW